MRLQSQTPITDALTDRQKDSTSGIHIVSSVRLQVRRCIKLVIYYKFNQHIANLNSFVPGLDHQYSRHVNMGGLT